MESERGAEQSAQSGLEMARVGAGSRVWSGEHAYAIGWDHNSIPLLGSNT